MICKNIDLYEYFNKPKKVGTRGILTLYLHDEFPEMGLERLRPAMLICPGGGYAYCWQICRQCRYFGGYDWRLYGDVSGYGGHGYGYRRAGAGFATYRQG